MLAFKPRPDVPKICCNCDYWKPGAGVNGLCKVIGKGSRAAKRWNNPCDIDEQGNPAGGP